MTTLILNQKAVQELLDMAEVIAVVEQAFKDWAQGKGQMPAKSYLLLESGDFRAMPAALPEGTGVKWVNVHPQNPLRGLPTVMGILIYNDPETGYPLAIMDAIEITAYRTGATAALASKYLARRDSRILGIIGAGRQAYTQIQAHARIFELDEVRVFDISPDATQRLMESCPNQPLRKCSLENAAGSEIICTLTHARMPYLKKEWIMPGTHINAIGADAKGKEELDPGLLKEAMVVVDDLRQAINAGEINVPVAKGLYSENEVHGTLAEIMLGIQDGRKDERSITVFDSTGLAIEDLAVGRRVYEKAKERGNYLSLNMIEV